MSNEILLELACPNCAHQLDITEPNEQIICPACHSQLLLEGHVCPNCSQYHPTKSAFCQACGTALTRTCEKCRSHNWSGTEHCRECGAALDIFQLVHLHNKQATMDRLDGQMRDAQFFKEKERVDSDRRMAVLMEKERERQLQVHARQQAIKQHDRQLMATAAIVLTIFIIIVAAFALL